MKLPIELTEECLDCQAMLKELNNKMDEARGSYDRTLTLVLNSDWAGRYCWHIESVKLGFRPSASTMIKEDKNEG